MDFAQPPVENYANPKTCFFHVLFKAAALAFYILSTLFFNSFVIIFVVTVLLSALDFWVVKNVSGRILVGLRWWNEINDLGESVWRFECLDQESLARMNKKDSWLFWWTLYLSAVAWIVLGIFSLIRFQADYLLVIGVCLTLNIANIVGFTKCQKVCIRSAIRVVIPLGVNRPIDAKKQIQQFATQTIASRFSSTIQGLIGDARALFDEMPERDVIMWTAMIAGYTSCNHYVHGWTLFCKMCLARGGLVHGMAMKLGLEGSLYVDNALMDMYATCCVSMEDACSVFRVTKEKNMVTWTTLITGYTHRGDGYGGLQVFREILLEGAELNPHSFSISISACATIDMYCRCGFLSEANEYFHEMTEKDLIGWNTLIAGYGRLDSYYLTSPLPHIWEKGTAIFIAACANSAVLNCGKQVHTGIVRRGLQGNPVLANALDMYAKCGSIADSHKIFSEMSDRNLVSWTSMMIGYGAHGCGKEAVKLFDEDDEGLRCFKSMSTYNVNPDQEIYGCVVDLLGRGGRVEEAYQLIKSMPFKPNESVWGALLGACKAHKLTKMGKLAAFKLLDLRPNNLGAYVILSNIYAAEGKWGEFARMRKLMRRTGSRKEAGRSWIEVRNQVYSFVVGDKVDSHTECLYGVVELLILHMKEAGYMPDLHCLIHDLEDGT
ncbi:Golgi apparatus membrane protein-like protein ECHIDNA [Hibiscus syriacus]|uniref:Golgi apparatus membrane protein-like protein ECHIDNA n=1 Tax=Hibiscus syriacus TaxID=106335 RepID=A0A6A2XHA3_HIBSY|nr:Golgi apparatus membrane protein-like protein ECHIDNA [Hibiscus syriacus]